MTSSSCGDLVISGIGIISAVGEGQSAFTAGLMEGGNAFHVMRRPGRQCNSTFLGAEISKFTPETTSLSVQAALAVIDEAWRDANLRDVDPGRIGLIVGGSNVQQREITLLHERYAQRVPFLRPSYGVSFMDSDICGHCSERFGIRGFAFTLGGASASGQLALVQGIEAVCSGQVDVCIVVGALMDLSYWECQAFRSMGAMGSDRFAAQPELASRPFDRDRDGFIFGESCGAIVIERSQTIARGDVKPYASVLGWAVDMDAHRAPDPSIDGETQAIRIALLRAGLTADDIDYVNPHGSGSPLGDETEARALIECGLFEARINATKSILGHGLAAAGAVEVIATLVQMRAARLHPTRNLENPIRSELNWVGREALEHTIQYALTLSMGFGGVNTALCLRRSSDSRN